jgi:hypothetical protein
LSFKKTVTKPEKKREVHMKTKVIGILGVVMAAMLAGVRRPAATVRRAAA